MNQVAEAGLDVARIAAQFPVLNQKVNGVPLAYLDNAATTQVPESVIAAMDAFTRHDRANIHRGAHTLSGRATDAFEAARANVKRFLHVPATHELIFTSGTTDALNLLAHGMAFSVSGAPLLHQGDEILVSGLEHHANLIPWQQAARQTGAVLRVVQPDKEGLLHVGDMRKLLTERTRVFAITACANATGYVPPFKDMARLAADAGAMTVVDAAQAVGHGTVDVTDWGCDFVAWSAHKMYGPMGMGGLVGRRELLDRLSPFRFGGDMVDWVRFDDAAFNDLPARLEGGTPNVTGTVGMSAAATFMMGIDHDALSHHLANLREHAVRALQRIDGLRVLIPGDEAQAIVSFVVDGVHPHDVGMFLDQKGVAVRTGHHCAQPLLDCMGVGSTTRASFAVYNNHDQIEQLVAGVERAIKVLR